MPEVFAESVAALVVRSFVDVPIVPDPEVMERVVVEIVPDN